MRGTLRKSINGWIVNHQRLNDDGQEMGFGNYETTPLHPDNILDADLMYPDSLDMDVEFEMESVCEPGKFEMETYARIISIIETISDDEVLDDEWLLKERYKMMLEFAEWFKVSDWKYDDETERGTIYTNSNFPSDKATIEEIYEHYIQYVLN